MGFYDEDDVPKPPVFWAVLGTIISAVLTAIILDLVGVI